MTDRPTAVPDGATAVIPHLVCADASAALAFYAAAFDAVEEMRMAGPDGKLMHTMTRINGAPVMLMDENPEWGAQGPVLLGGTPVEHPSARRRRRRCLRTSDRGSVPPPLMEPADQFWGDRYGVVQDPFGHQWSLSQPLADGPRTPEEMHGRVRTHDDRGAGVTELAVEATGLVKHFAGKAGNVEAVRGSISQSPQAPSSGFSTERRRQVDHRADAHHTDDHHGGHRPSGWSRRRPRTRRRASPHRCRPAGGRSRPSPDRA